MADDQHLFGDPLLAMLRDARPAADADLSATSPRALALFERITATPPEREGGRGARWQVRPMRTASRRVWLAIAATAAAAAIVAGTLVALGGSSGGGGGLRPGEVMSSADLLAKMTTAVDQVAGDVVEANAVHGRATIQSWGAWNSYPAHAIYRYDGRICFETRETATLLTVVDHVTRTWSTRPVPRRTWLSPKVSGCKLTGYIATPLALMPGGPASEGTWWKRVISRGYFTVDRATVMDGQRALELTERTPRGVSEHIWISASTYLPLRVSVSFPGSGLPDFQSDTSYLTPTKANLALLALQIPDGFVHQG